MDNGQSDRRRALRRARIRPARRVLDPFADARRQGGDRRLDSRHRGRRHLAQPAAVCFHPALSPDQRPDLGVRRGRSHVGPAFHAQIRSGDHQCGNGVAFAIGAFGTKPLIQEVAEQRAGTPFPDAPDVRRFFQIFTLFWAVYFFAKALLYCWLAWTLPIMQAMALRSILGGVSLGVMIALSMTQGRRMFFLCRWLGLLPAPAGSERGKPLVAPQ